MSTQQTAKLQANKSTQQATKSAELTPTTPAVETTQVAASNEQQPTVSEVHLEEAGNQSPNNYALIAANMLGVTVTELDALTQYCLINKDKLLKKVKEKGLASTWKHVQKKSGVTIEAGKISQLIQLGVLNFANQIIAKVKEQSEACGELLENNFLEMYEAYSKAFAKTKNRTTALRKAILKLDFMGITGDVVLVHPYTIKVLELVDTHLPSPNPTVGARWQSGSFGRALSVVFRNHKKENDKKSKD